MTADITQQLTTLLSAPTPSSSQTASLSLLPPPSTPLSQLPTILSTLLSTSQSRLSHLSPLLTSSTASTSTLLQSTRQKLVTLRERTERLREGHEALVERLIDTREELESSVGERERGGRTLREKLVELKGRRQGLESAKEVFEILTKAEELGLSALKSLLVDSDRDAAFSTYTSLVTYTNSIHSLLPSLALSTQLIAMSSSVFNSLAAQLSKNMESKLEKIEWPKPLKERKEWNESKELWEVRLAIIDLILLEKLNASHPLPSLLPPITTNITSKPPLAKPYLPLIPLLPPLLLRFSWQFDGTRTTNRIDRPEWALSHMLNLVEVHKIFVGEMIGSLFEDEGVGLDSLNEFISLLIPPLRSRLLHHIPQLLELPPILAHTIYQTLEFDGVLRGRGYRPRVVVGGEEREWEGLSEVILGVKERREVWLRGEKEFFDNKYYAIISAPDAWVILSEEDYDTASEGGGSTGVRPTNSALRVAELAELCADRYRPLPLVHQPPFLLSLHLPLLSSYIQRITSSLDAFESLSFGLALPGALGVGGDRHATAGVGGIIRLLRAGVSARWMEERCRGWGEEAFFVGLLDALEKGVRGEVVGVDLRGRLGEVLEEARKVGGGGTLFEGVRGEFARLAARAEELIVRHVVKEVMGDLKTYLGRRWDYTSTDIDPNLESEASSDDLALTSDLISPLSLFTSLLTTLVQSLPSSTSTHLYRRISSQLSSTLYSQLIINRPWTEHAALQFVYDFENGFLQAGREAGIKRGVGKGWELLKGASIILALPATGEVREGQVTFAMVMRMAFDEAVPEEEGSEFRDLLEGLGVGEVVRKKQIRQVMRRRPECWR